MLRNVYLKTLRDQRRSFAWWSVGLVAMSIFMMALFPTVKDSAAQLNTYIEKMPDTMKALFGGFSDYTTLTGYLKAELFNFMVPILFLIFAVGAGSRAIAGEEERGTLDLLLANPVSRRRVVLHKLGALVTTTAGLAVLLWAGVAIGSLSVGSHLALGRLAEQMVSLVLLAIAFGSVALAVGCWRGSRGIASATAGGLAVAAYLVNALAPTVSWLGPYRRFSLFFYYAGHDPIVNGLSVAHVVILLAVGAAFVTAAVVGFDRRDLSA
jgi:ABC-2 type transport system permease protein